jgi:hypothetical protein
MQLQSRLETEKEDARTSPHSADDDSVPWHLQVFAPCNKEDVPLSAKDVRAITMEQLNVKLSQTTNILTELGFLLNERDVTGKKRCVKFRFPEQTRAVPVKMKLQIAP